MKELYRLLGVKLAATTAYHPQGYGQTERVNQELEQFLHLFINQRQDDWDELLPSWNSSTTTTSILQLRTSPFSWTLATDLVWDLNQTNTDPT